MQKDLSVNEQLFNYALEGRKDCIQVLHETGNIDITVEDNEAFIHAVIGGHLDTVKYLAECTIEKGDSEDDSKNKVKAIVNSQDSEAIIYAVKNYSEDKPQYKEIVNYLLEKGVNASAQNSEAVYWAAYNKNLDIVEALHEKGASLDKALLAAAYMSNEDMDIAVDIVKYCLENGVNGAKILEQLAENNKFDEVKFLIENGIQGTEKTIEYAINNENQDMADYITEHMVISSLVKQGINEEELLYVKESLKAKEKEELVVYAADNGYSEVAKYLIKDGASGVKALVEASKVGDLDKVKWLVDNGADITAGFDKNDKIYNHEAFIAAEENGNDNIVQYIKSIDKTYSWPDASEEFKMPDHDDIISLYKRASIIELNNGLSFDEYKMIADTIDNAYDTILTISKKNTAIQDELEAIRKASEHKVRTGTYMSDEQMKKASEDLAKRDVEQRQILTETMNLLNGFFEKYNVKGYVKSKDENDNYIMEQTESGRERYVYEKDENGKPIQKPVMFTNLNWENEITIQADNMVGIVTNSNSKEMMNGKVSEDSRDARKIAMAPQRARKTAEYYEKVFKDANDALKETEQELINEGLIRVVKTKEDEETITYSVRDNDNSFELG